LSVVPVIQEAAPERPGIKEHAEETEEEKPRIRGAS